MGREKQVNVRLSTEQKAKWDRYVANEPQWSSISDLIRGSVEMHIETDGQSATVAETGTNDGRLDSFERRLERIDGAVEQIKETLETVADAVDEPDVGHEPRIMEVLPPAMPQSDEWDYWASTVEAEAEDEGHAVDGTAESVRDALVAVYADTDAEVRKYTVADIRERLARLEERTSMVQSAKAGEDPRRRWWIDE